MLDARDTLKADVVLGLYVVIAKVKEAKHLSHLSAGDYSWLSFPEVCALCRILFHEDKGSVVTRVCNSGTLEAEARKLPQVCGQPGLLV